MISTLSREQLSGMLAERILILDGAMGTMIQRRNLLESDFRGDRFENWERDLKGNNDLLSLTRPDVIREIHLEYLLAGADIIETNTFNSTAISQADYGMEALAYELNETGARIAKEAVVAYQEQTGRSGGLVAGVLGPTNRTASLSPDVENPGFRNVSFDQLESAYHTAARGLQDGGADIFLVETIFDTLNAKAAIHAIRRLERETGRKMPVMISVTVSDASGRTLSGQTVAAFCNAVEHADPVSVGLNCALGSREMRDHLKEIHRNVSCFVSLHPNAGLPDELGNYNESPAFMADVLADYAAEGWLNLAGGCCGTTPDHIRAIADRLAGATPRKPGAKRSHCVISGLETLEIKPESLFVNIGERTNVAGSRKFARLIRDGRYEEALSVARQQVMSGAQMIDVNMDDAMLDAPVEMTRFLNMLAADPDIGRVPVMIDSSRFDVLEAGLKCIQGKGVVNSISLKEGETVFLEQARRIRDFGAAVVVMAFNESGQATTVKDRLDILTRARDRLVQDAGYVDADIILDPNIYAIGTGIADHDRYALDYLETVEALKQQYPDCLVSGGVSNLSFSFRGRQALREAMHAVFLFHAIGRGMDMGIVNAGAMPGYPDIDPDLREKLEDLIFDRRQDATDRVLAVADAMSDQKGVSETDKPDWRSMTVEGRIKESIIKGYTEYLEVDIEEARLHLGSAIAVIEGPLMAGMSVVGDRFGAGQMFLPQVVRSARVMKQAVSQLTPWIESEQGDVEGGTTDRKKIVLATVKGDVHDIGKNIVAVVMRCNNYEVIDLGVMVPTSRILDEAEACDADAVGLSGLITPSLDEMVHVAEEMEKRAMDVPLLIGGATTSAVHTAVKIDPVYGNPVVHVPDASRAIDVLGSLFSSRKRDYVRELADFHEHKRHQRSKRAAASDLLSLADARENRFRPAGGWSQWAPDGPAMPGVHVERSWDIPQLIPFIDWQYFLLAWEFKGTVDDILADPVRGDEARRLMEDAAGWLDRIAGQKLLECHAVWGVFPACSDGDDIVLTTPDGRERCCMLRQQKVKKDGSPNYCLSDFVAPGASGVQDHVGLFVTTAGIGLDHTVQQLDKEGDEYGALMVKILADRLAEALAEALHQRVRKKTWGYAADEELSPEDLLKERYRGIRPAPGYPPCPDHDEKRKLFRILQAESTLGVTLTESLMMVPAASVCGFYLAHPESRYFSVGRIGEDQLSDYAKRKQVPEAEVHRWLKQNID